MSTWKDLAVDVIDDLVLDPRNVRLEETVQGAPESDIIQDLFANEKAFTLVEAIAKIGYLTHEIPIVVRRGKQLVVVEGNRRVAALKAIQNPYLAPAFTAKINGTIEGLDRKALRKIFVKLAPNQDQADQLIAALHTGQQRVAWKPARQQAFFQAQIDAGKTLSLLLQQYPTVNVIGFVGESRILQLFRDAHYTNDELKKFINSRKFPISTLARLYDNEEFLKLVGILHDRKTAEVALYGDSKIFDKVAQHVVNGIKHEGLNTRTLNKTDSDSYKELMDQVREIVDSGLDARPDPQSGATPKDAVGSSAQAGRATQTDHTGNSSGASGSDEKAGKGGATEGDPQPAAGPQATPRLKKFLDLDAMTVAPTYPIAIHSIFEEMRSLNVERFPNATLDLMRTFLEKTIKAYAERQGSSITKASNSNGFVQLGDCLIWLENYFKTQGPRSFIQVVQKIRSGKMKDYIIGQDHLNAINHNHQIFATPSDVRETWATMRGLMELMLK